MIAITSVLLLHYIVFLLFIDIRSIFTGGTGDGWSNNYLRSFQIFDQGGA
jgi:hypothetical protein